MADDLPSVTPLIDTISGRPDDSSLPLAEAISQFEDSLQIDAIIHRVLHAYGSVRNVPDNFPQTTYPQSISNGQLSPGQIPFNEGIARVMGRGRGTTSAGWTLFSENYPGGSLEGEF